jgi:glyoxylase-like metal-dependent hydrolase (beta-lactamase superfamily II)
MIASCDHPSTASSMSVDYEIYAVRYAHLERTARFNFLGGDAHDGPMPLDYFVWAIVGAGRTIVVDTGFDAEQARKRKRTLVRPVAEGLRAIGITHAEVRDVVITHMHPSPVSQRPHAPAGRGDALLHRPVHDPC